MIRFAIVTTLVPRRKGTGPPRPPHSFRMMALETEKMGMVPILVHPDDFHADHIKGWIGRQIGKADEKWVRKTMPLPDVVYDNVFVHLVNRGKTIRLRRICRRRRIPLFNPYVPNKWIVHRILQRIPETASCLPVTRHARDPQDVFDLLNRFQTVYVKPAGGYGGQGVTRIAKMENGLYHVEIDRLHGTRVCFKKSMAEPQLRRWLRHRLRSRHIVQQALRLMQVDGGQLDFRVVVQRTADGEWMVIGIVPKIAAVGGVVTNLVAGGRKTSLDWLTEWASRHGKTIPLHRLETAVLRIAGVWSKRLPTLAILGFDMGVDVNGKVWMIELNTKPARSLLTPAMQQKSYRAFAEFAHYLATRR
ncbi:YheC/YheD family endospore coat-associated protein [Effusibacillus pohliae]|uniref:YheC/YheD family endospore coat-associated protein n=1 Tax=Effusibacillus pohliae TaxID=232270 RepID=UPI00036BAF1C|nr:YheC/YheD family protein [Effusibacillus pohliae]